MDPVLALFEDEVIDDPVLALFDNDGDIDNVPKRPCHRHAFGTYRMGCMPLPNRSPPTSVVLLNQQTDIEEENVCPKKIVVHRGKRPRKSRMVTKEPYVLKKKERAMLEDEIASVLHPCCPKECYKTFTFADIKEERYQFWQLNAPMQQDYLCRELAFNGVANRNKGTFDFKYMVNTKECCPRFYKRALPVSHGRLSAARTRVVTKNFEDVTFSSPEGSKSTTKTDACESFIRKYAGNESGQMPDSVNCQLSEGVTKEDVYTSYLASYEDDPSSDPASLSCWYESWASRCPCVTTNKWQRFSKCTVCSNLKSLREFSNATERGKCNYPRIICNPGFLTNSSITSACGLILELVNLLIFHVGTSPGLADVRV